MSHLVGRVFMKQIRCPYNYCTELHCTSTSAFCMHRGRRPRSTYSRKFFSPPEYREISVLGKKSDFKCGKVTDLKSISIRPPFCRLLRCQKTPRQLIGAGLRGSPGPRREAPRRRPQILRPAGVPRGFRSRYEKRIQIWEIFRALKAHPPFFCHLPRSDSRKPHDSILEHPSVKSPLSKLNPQELESLALEAVGKGADAAVLNGAFAKALVMLCVDKDLSD